MSGALDIVEDRTNRFMKIQKVAHLRFILVAQIYFDTICNRKIEPVIVANSMVELTDLFLPIHFAVH